MWAYYCEIAHVWRNLKIKPECSKKSENRENFESPSTFSFVRTRRNRRERKRWTLFTAWRGFLASNFLKDIWNLQVFNYRQNSMQNLCRFFALSSMIFLFGFSCSIREFIFVRFHCDVIWLLLSDLFRYEKILQGSIDLYLYI